MSISTIPSDLIPQLRETVHGRVIGPDDTDYDAARAVVYGGIDQRPAVIARVAHPGDIATVIATARDTGLPLAVRSGGHSGAGHGSVEGGIVIDVRELDGLDIDPVARTAWAGSGLTAGAYTSAAAEHGLATGFGDTGSVGLGGLITGGGVGYLVRKHGLTIDNLLAAEIVTADGQVHMVDEDHEPDLFWAIRGGGGNFGVVTRFKLRLHVLDGVVGGMLIQPATAESIAGFIAAAEAAPEELSTIANVMNCPPMPFVAEEHHGKLVIFGMLAYAGDADRGERALAPFRALAEPLADMTKPIPYPEMFPPEDPDYHPTAVSTTMFIDRVDLPVAETIMEHLAASDASLRAAQLRVLGGGEVAEPPEIRPDQQPVLLGCPRRKPVAHRIEIRLVEQPRIEQLDLMRIEMRRCAAEVLEVADAGPVQRDAADRQRSAGLLAGSVGARRGKKMKTSIPRAISDP